MAKLSPFSVKNSRLSFHLPGFHILKSPLTSSHLLIFILILLAGTAFDGFKETTHWFSLYYSFLHTFEFLFPLFTYQFIQLASYVILVLLFVGLYFLAIWLTHLLTKTSSIKSLALSYAGTLIPILLGYNIAHYFSLVLIQGQTIIPLISDPFGFGWNLLGTANFKPNITILSLTTIWHLQVAAIILGHILAVILTHFIGLNAKVPRKQFILSQIPLLILMIFYTMGGLWLLSLPLN